MATCRVELGRMPWALMYQLPKALLDCCAISGLPLNFRVSIEGGYLYLEWWRDGGEA